MRSELTDQGIVQVLSNMEANVAFLPDYLLYYANMNPSDSSQAFYNSFGAIIWKCSSDWDRSLHWAENAGKQSKREDDNTFCNQQALTIL